MLWILLNKTKSTHIIDLYAIMNALPIPIMHEMQLLMLIHKCYFHQDSLLEIIQNYFSIYSFICVLTNVIRQILYCIVLHCSSVHHYNTKRITDLHIFSVNTMFGQRCSVYWDWNNRPVHLKSQLSLAVFKKDIKKFVFERSKAPDLIGVS